jgi:pyruvate-formate lyase-activating enzyme
MIDLDFVVEVLVLHIPNYVEADQHRQIARLIVDIAPDIPTTLLAFFPSYQLMDNRAPTFDEMMVSYEIMKGEGLENIRLGNIGVFAKTKEQRFLVNEIRRK